MTPRPLDRRSPRRSRGISLIISMVLMLVASLAAVMSLRGVTLQTRMTAAAHDRNLAFQAAEAALREAETVAAGATEANFPAVGCTGIFCATPALTSTSRWLDDSFAGWNTTSAAVSTDAPATGAIVEAMGEAPNWLGCENEIPRQPNCRTARYRVSARSSSADRAAVIVQSDVAAP